MNKRNKSPSSLTVINYSNENQNMLIVLREIAGKYLCKIRSLFFQAYVPFANDPPSPSVRTCTFLAWLPLPPPWRTYFMDGPFDGYFSFNIYHIILYDAALGISRGKGQLLRTLPSKGNDF